MKKVLFISLIVLSSIVLTGCGKKEEKLTRVYSYTADEELNLGFMDPTIGEKIEIEKTEKDYKKINHNVFLAMDIDKDNIVKNIEVCGVLHSGLDDEKMFCLKSDTNKAKETLEELSNDYELCDYQSFGDNTIDCTGKEIYYSIDESDSDVIEIGVVDENPFAFERCVLWDSTAGCGSK